VPGGLAERDSWGLGLPIVVDRDAARAMVVRGFQTSPQTVGGGGGAGEPVGLSILPLGGVAASYLYRAGRWHLQAEHNLFIVSTSLLAYLLVAVGLRSAFLVVLQVFYPSILTSCTLKKNRTITIPCPTCPKKKRELAMPISDAGSPESRKCIHRHGIESAVGNFSWRKWRNELFLQVNEFRGDIPKVRSLIDSMLSGFAMNRPNMD